MKISKHNHSGDGHPQWKDYLDGAQKGLACLAIIAAALWFFLRAETSGKAICSHQLSMVQVSNGKTNLWWGSLEVKIENVGRRPLEFSEGRLRIYQIKPLPDDFDFKLNDADDRIFWPMTFSITNRQEHEVFPDETDYEYFEFTMPTNVEAFRVYTFFPNKSAGWSKASIYEIRNGTVIHVKEPEDVIISSADPQNPVAPVAMPEPIRTK